MYRHMLRQLQGIETTLDPQLPRPWVQCPLCPTPVHLMCLLGRRHHPRQRDPLLWCVRVFGWWWWGCEGGGGLLSRALLQCCVGWLATPPCLSCPCRACALPPPFHRICRVDHRCPCCRGSQRQQDGCGPVCGPRGLLQRDLGGCGAGSRRGSELGHH